MGGLPDTKQKRNEFQEELLVRCHGLSPGELEALSRKIAQNKADQKDLTQEMYLTLLEAPPGQTKSWHKQRCYYRAIDYIRHNNHHPTNKDAYILEHTAGESILEIQKKIDLSEIKEKADQILSPQEQQIFVAYYIDGLTQKEISRQFSLTRACLAKKLERMCHKIGRSYVIYSEILNLARN